VEAGAGGYDKVKDQGGTNAAAWRGFGGEALKTVPGTLLTLAAGPLAGKVVRSVYPMAAHSAANLLATMGGKAAAGEDATPTAEDVVNSILFAAMGGSGKLHAEARAVIGGDPMTAKAVLSGEHPEVVRIDDMASGKTAEEKPGEREAAARYAAALRKAAADCLKSQPPPSAPGAPPRPQKFEGAPYHHEQSSGQKGPPPVNEQASLEASIAADGQTGWTTPDGKLNETRRIGLLGGTAKRPFAIFDYTGNDTWHGHICSLEELRQRPEWWQAFTNRKVIDKNGRIARKQE
jgi:hypothetical protein